MKKINARLAAAAGAAGAVVIGLSSLGAGGAAAGPLPNASNTKTLADGTPVTISILNQSYSVQRQVTNVQTSRNVWVSGKVKAVVGGKATGGAIKAGYQFGCQVTFGASAGTGGGLSVAPPAGAGGQFTATPDANATAGVTLGPGSSQVVWIINTTSGSNTAYDSYNVNNYTFKGNVGGVAYSQEAVKVDGCAGYAEARAIAQVTVDTDSVKGVVSIAGPKFSLG
ncbi:MspA family porin [Gordonia sp. NPDC003424]